MKRKMSSILISGIILFILLSIGGLTFSQGQVANEEAAPAATAEPEIQWVWGEVVSVDLVNKTLLIRYPDYEADQEKEMAVGIDDKTAYENVSYLDSIKPDDTVSIDYTLSPEGKFIARHISVEKPEVQTTEIQPEPEMVPESIQGKIEENPSLPPQ